MKWTVWLNVLLACIDLETLLNVLYMVYHLVIL